MTLDPFQRTNLKISAGAVAVSLAFVSPLFALSLAVGAALEAANFHGLHGSAELMFDGARNGRRGFAAGFGLRFVLLAVGIGAAIAVGAHPVGLVIGLSTILPAAVIEAWRARPLIEAAATGLAPDDPAWDRWNPWLARERAEEEEAGEER